MRVRTAILMFCFPIALHAEIYSCTSTGGVMTDADGNALEGLPSPRPVTFIVDTEKGIRTDALSVDRADSDGDYFGTCQNSNWKMDDGTAYKAHFCYSNLEVPMINVTTIYIQTKTEGFRFNAAFLGIGPSYRGKCLEI